MDRPLQTPQAYGAGGVSDLDEQTLSVQRIRATGRYEPNLGLDTQYEVWTRTSRQYGVPVAVLYGTASGLALFSGDSTAFPGVGTATLQGITTLDSVGTNNGNQYAMLVANTTKGALFGSLQNDVPDPQSVGFFPTVDATYDLGADEDTTTFGVVRWRDLNLSRNIVFGDATTQASASPATAFNTPAIVLGTAAAAGTGTEVIRHNATIVAFDATVPVTQAFGDAAATGSAAITARRDHKHGMPRGVTTVLKTADESDTVGTLQNDNLLLLALAANETWAFEFVLFIDNAGTTGAFQFDIGTITSAVGNYDSFAIATTGGFVGTADYALALGTALVINTAAVAFEVHIKGVIDLAGTAGNLQLRWAQLVADATATKVLANSYLIAHKLV